MVGTRILTVGNQKGGVGKTFTSKHIAEYAALCRKLRVLLIDLDPQTNLSHRYLSMVPLNDDQNEYSPPVHPDYDPEDEDWAQTGGHSDASHIWKYGFAIPYHTQYEGLDIIPAHSQSLQDIEYITKEDVHDSVVRWLRKFLLLEEIQEEYDLIVLDTRPSRGPLVQAAAVASTHMLIPTEMESPAIDGLRSMLSVLTRANFLRDPGDPLRLVGIQVNKFKTHTRLHESIRQDLMEDPDLEGVMLPEIINDWVRYKELMWSSEASVFTRTDCKREREQMEGVCAAIIDRMFSE